MAAGKAAGARGGGGGASGPALLLLLVAVLGGGVYWLHGRAARAVADLERHKDEYRRMVSMRRRLEELKKSAPRAPAAPEGGGEDLLATLGAKGRQANLPPGGITIARNADRKEGGWKEVSYTVTLRAPAKDQPLAGGAVADFVSMVERERPAVKSKNLSLVYAGANFASATITFSLYQREPAGP